MKKLLLIGAALAALSNSAHAHTIAECANAIETGNNPVFNACADVVENVLKENSCTKFNPGGVYTATVDAWKKASEGHPITLAILAISWEQTIRQLVVPRKERC